MRCCNGCQRLFRTTLTWSLTILTMKITIIRFSPQNTQAGPLKPSHLVALWRSCKSRRPLGSIGYRAEPSATHQRERLHHNGVMEILYCGELLMRLDGSGTMLCPCWPVK